MGLPNFTDEAIRDPEVNSLTTKTKMVEQGGSSGPGTMGIKLQVIMNDGREFTESKPANREWVKNPITRDTIIKKYWHQVEFTKNIPQSKAGKILDLILNLENVEDVGLLVEQIAH
jgi:hypothetical protein